MHLRNVYSASQKDRAISPLSRKYGEDRSSYIFNSVSIYNKLDSEIINVRLDSYLNIHWKNKTIDQHYRRLMIPEHAPNFQEIFSIKLIEFNSCNNSWLELFEYKYVDPHNIFFRRRSLRARILIITNVSRQAPQGE